MCSFSAGFGAMVSSFDARPGADTARNTASMRSGDSGCPFPGSCFRNSSLTMTPVATSPLGARTVAAEEKRCVRSAESEGVRERELHPGAPGHVGHVVEVACGIRVLV